MTLERSVNCGNRRSSSRQHRHSAAGGDGPPSMVLAPLLRSLPCSQTVFRPQTASQCQEYLFKPKSSAGIQAHARGAENACPSMRLTATCVCMMPAESPGHVGRISRAILPRAVLDAAMIMPDHIHEIIVIRGRGEACVPFHVCRTTWESDASPLRTRLAHVIIGHADGQSPFAFFLFPQEWGTKGVEAQHSVRVGRCTEVREIAAPSPRAAR